MVELNKAEERDLKLLMTWLHTADDAQVWGGPSITYPFELETLKEQIEWSLHRSFSLMVDNEVVGFAQVAQRFGNDHLCRVLINPKFRGQGLGNKLLELILANDEAEPQKFSLFVYDSNTVAINLYRKLGFENKPIPAGVANMVGCLFMVR